VLQTTKGRAGISGRLGVIVLIVAMLFGFTACEGGSVEVSVDGGEGTAEIDAEGFFVGLWHGFISPFTGLASLFNEDVDPYADNAGNGYAIGFALGLILIVLILLSLFTGPAYLRRR
jgi:hypothetical protein